MPKFVLAVFFIWIALFQNIVSATDYNEINWNDTPHFNNKPAFVNYIRDLENNCESFIPVVFTDGLFVNVEEFLKITRNSQYVNLTWWNDGKGRPEKVIYELSIYPGAKVAHAYLTGDTSKLSSEERKLYNIAVKIVQAAKQQPTPLRKEYYIHEKITELASYYTAETGERTPRHCTAIGALIDGKANCQGYADAFYMLGKMLGFNVGKMSGFANNTPHVWNTIEFGDGRIYGVDVTWDDASFTLADSGEYNNYIYFNAPLEIMNTTHTWEAEYNPALYPKIDGRYFYFTREFSNTNGDYFAFHSDTAEDALGYIAQRIAKDDRRLSWGMAPYEANYGNVQFALNRLAREILPQRYNFYGHVKMSVARRGNWIYYTVDATRNN